MYNPPYIFNKNKSLHGKTIHLGVCGSIAAFRAADLVRWWIKNSIHVSLTLSEAANRFINPLTFEALGANPVHTSMWDKDNIFGHLDPGHNAHAMLIAPASASTIAQIAGGNAHSMLACQALAFPGQLMIAPAMNPHMWKNPATQANIQTLRSRNIEIILPDCGNTACGDEGQGRLADLRNIWLSSIKMLSPQDLKNKTVMLTIGPTREKWDAVRFWSNPSTGTMGTALAITAWLRGAEVYAICGPISQESGYIPPDIHTYRVNSAKEMYQAASDIWPTMDMGIFTAAVADYSPIPYEKGSKVKFKKENAVNELNIKFSPNIDILKTLASNKKPEQKMLGFAAESINDTKEMLKAVRKKLIHKNVDIIAGNSIIAENSGFGTKDNSMFIIDKFGREEVWPNLSKLDVAWRLCTWLQEI